MIVESACRREAGEVGGVDQRLFDPYLEKDVLKAPPEGLILVSNKLKESQQCDLGLSHDIEDEIIKFSQKREASINVYLALLLETLHKRE